MGLSKFTEHNDFVLVPSFDPYSLFLFTFSMCHLIVYLFMFFILTKSCQPIKCQNWSLSVSKGLKLLPCPETPPPLDDSTKQEAGSLQRSCHKTPRFSCLFASYSSPACLFFFALLFSLCQLEANYYSSVLEAAGSV